MFPFRYSSYRSKFESSIDLSKTDLPETLSSLEDAKSQVKQGKKRYLLLDFYAAWCPDCKLMESLFSDPQIKDILNHKFAYVKVDVGRFDKNLSLYSKYEVGAVTTLVVINSSGEMVEKKVFEPVTNAKNTCGVMDREKLRKYLLSL